MELFVVFMLKHFVYYHYVRNEKEDDLNKGCTKMKHLNIIHNSSVDNAIHFSKGYKVTGRKYVTLTRPEQSGHSRLKSIDCTLIDSSIRCDFKYTSYYFLECLINVMKDYNVLIEIDGENKTIDELKSLRLIELKKNNLI